MSESRKAYWYLENHLVALISVKTFPWSHQNLISQDPEKGDFMLSILSLALFFHRNSDAAECSPALKTWCCSKERLVELTQFSGKGANVLPGPGFPLELHFFLC